MLNLANKPKSIIFQQTIAAWNNVFYINAGFYTFAFFVFTIFGRTSVQKWNTYWEDEADQYGKLEETSPLLAKEA